MTTENKKRRLSPNRAALSPRKLAVEEMRAEIARLYSSDFTMTQIAVQLGITRQAVGYHLRVIHQRAIESQVTLLQEWQAKLLVNLERAGEDAWDAWERSRKPVVMSRQVIDRDGRKRVLRMIRRSAGNPQLLDQYQQALERIAVILGLWRPNQVNQQFNFGAPPPEPNEDIRRELAALISQQIQRMEANPTAALEGRKSVEVPAVVRPEHPARSSGSATDL